MQYASSEVSALFMQVVFYHIKFLFAVWFKFQTKSLY